MRRPSRAGVALLAALLALSALAAGCERRAQDPPEAAAPAATIVASADHGAESLLEARVEPGVSLMRALRGATDVRTAHGGGFVAEMLGRQSDADGQRDWFFWVNGVSSPVGAQEIELREGDAAWWDHRPWGGLPFVPGVVGLWPAPFAHPGEGGPGPVRADPPLRAALEEAGAEIAEGQSAWRVLVGSHEELVEREPAWRDAAADPDAAGLSVAVEDGRVTALTPDGARRAPVEGARALAAMVPTGEEPRDGMLLAVAGLDAAAARAAAERIAEDPGVLRLRYAVAFDGEGTPLRAGGRSGP